MTRYGSYEQLANRFSYLRMNDLAQNPIKVFREDSPSLRRIDIVYGRGSARLWLFDVLQATFGFLGVMNDRFSKEQIIDLAGTIVASPKFGSLKIGEFVLFLSRFKSGAYGRFYGSDSYALVVMGALHKFWDERTEFYQKIDEEDRKREEQESKRNAVTFKEWKAMKESKGEKVNLTDDEVESIIG